MRPVIFGATGMVGSGVLRECLLDPRVEDVLVVGRSSCGIVNTKLREVIHADLFDAEPLAADFADRDACFFCLGATSNGLDEAAYRHVTHDLAVGLAQVMVRSSAGVTMCFISGKGSDSSEKGRLMWARVKGAVENAMLRAGFRATYLLRPGFIQPLHGARSRTTSYRIAYLVLAPVVGLMRRLFPRQVTTTVAIGQAMINVVERGYPKSILESADIEIAARLG